MTTWPQLQQEVTAWAFRNFGAQAAWQPMLGLIEEVGEFLAHRENPMFDTSGRSAHNLPEMEDALADQAIYALNLCDICGIKFGPDIVLFHSPEFLSDAQLLGALAAACHAVLKEAQGIRGYDRTKRREEVGVALALWYRWASAQHLTFRLRPLLDCTTIVWEQVRKRDWAKNPDDAHRRVASQEQRMVDDLQGGK